MKLSSKYIWLIFVFVAVAVTFIGFLTYRSLREAAMKPCLMSLEKPIVEMFAAKDPSFTSLVTQNWRQLDSEESSHLLSQLVTTGRTDCGSIENMRNGKDFWGNNIKMAFRSNDQNSIEIRIWSLGPDGEESTADDLGFENRRTIR